MRLNMVGAFVRNFPFGTEIAFLKGLQRLKGVEVTTVDPSVPGQRFDEEADFTLVFKDIEQADYMEALDRLKGKKVVYQPDDLRFPHIAAMMQKMRQHCDYALCFDRDCADIAKRMGFLASKKLLVTADPELYHRIGGLQKDIDFAFIGSYTGGTCHTSRRRMVQMLRDVGFNVVVGTDMHDIAAINLIYNRSKVVLNHATDVGQPFGHGYGFQCRHFEAGFAGACVLSNEVDNWEEGDPTDFFSFRGKDDLVSLAWDILDDTTMRELVADDFYRELNESHRPEHRARQLLDFLEDDCS